MYRGVYLRFREGFAGLPYPILAVNCNENKQEQIDLAAPCTAGILAKNRQISKSLVLA